MMKYVVSVLMVLLLCGFVDSQAQGVAAKNCVEKCCGESGGTFNNGCDFGGAEPGDNYGDCLSSCMSGTQGGSGVGATGQGPATKEVPEAAKACLKKCCDQINGAYDPKTSYCNTDYDTSMQEGFQSCERNCVTQNMHGNSADTQGGGASAGSNPGGNQESGKASTSCIPLITGVIALVTAGVGTKLL